MYNTTAFLYEATAAFEAPEKTCDEIQGFFADCGIEPPGLLGDLGSGTGLMSVLLAERGWQVEWAGARDADHAVEILLGERI